MFERMTDRGRRVIVLAQEEARCLNHNYIGTEHVLLGLIHEGEGLAAQVLMGPLELSLEELRKTIEDIIGHGQQTPEGHITFTPRAKKVLELSLREALQLGHNYIGTEHILLGIIREGDGVGAQVLAKHNVDLTTARKAIIEKMTGKPVSDKSQALNVEEAAQMGKQMAEALRKDFTHAVNSKVVVSSLLGLDKLLRKHGIDDQTKGREELLIDLLDWKMTV